MASFDVTNLYGNVPVDNSMTILRISLIKTNRLNRNEIDEIMQLLKTLLRGNYFHIIMNISYKRMVYLLGV